MMIFIPPRQMGYTVYTKSGCPYCVKVKDLFLSKGITDIQYMDCDGVLADDKEGFLAFIRRLTGVSYRTFPIVFYDGKLLGGFIDTRAHFEAEAEKDLAFDGVEF